MSDFDNKVSEFFNDYHRKVKSNPDLYAKNEDHLTVVLPQTLLEYSNAAAGHSGFGSGARAIGIRLRSANPRLLRDKVMSSIGALTDFILSSDRSGPAYVNTVRARHLGTTKSKFVQMVTDDRLINSKGGRSAMLIKFGAQVFIQLGRKYGRDTVKNDIECLTVHEFATRYAIESKVDINRLEMHRGPFPRIFA